MKSKQKILILGSNGFIGNHLVNYFLSQSYIVFGCDLTLPISNSYEFYQVKIDGSGLKDIFKSQRFEFCVNAAGNGNVNFSVTNPEDDFNANVRLTLQVLDCIRLYSPECKFVQISSAAVYGNPEKLPINENDRLKPISPYGWHKLFSEKLCREYFELFQVKSSIIRPFSVYGPGLKKQLLWDVFNKVKNNEDDLELWGTGDETRDFIHINDLVKSIEMIFQKAPMMADVYNIGFGEMNNISNVVKLFLDFLGKKNKICFNGNNRKGDPLKWQSDISKIKSVGFTPAVSLENGLLSLANWLQKQQ